MKSNEEISSAFDWQMISTPQFKNMLYYNTKTGVYKTDGNTVVEPTDERLISFLEMSTKLTPVDLNLV